MPGRYLREGILDSDRVDQLGHAEEVFYRRLMSAVDDWGIFDGRPSILKSRLYPLRSSTVRESDIPLWIAKCVKARLIALYHVDGKPYIYYGNLGEPRAKKSKYPPPPLEAIEHLGFASVCTQTHADAPPTPTPTPTVSPYPPRGDGEIATQEKTPKDSPQSLADAIAKCAGIDVDRDVTAAAKTLLGRTPPYTVDEVFDFRQKFQRICTWAVKQQRFYPTVKEIVKYIGRLRTDAAPPKARPTPTPTIPDPTDADRELLKRLIAEKKR